MPEIKIKISEKIALCRKRYLISSNENYTVTFEFDNEWKEHEAKTARFFFDSSYVDVAFLGNTVSVPKVIPCETLGIGVFTDGLSSTAADIGCVLSAKDLPTEKVGELTNDQYETLLSLLNALDLRQIKSVERIGGNVKIIYTDETTSVFPIYDGVSVSGATVNEEGVLTLTLSDGKTLTAGNVKGEKGEKGEPGKTPVFSVGTVQTLESDETASASITGSADEPVLNLALPRGKGGDGTWKCLYSGTLTQAQKSFEFHTFPDGTPLKFTELFIKGAATTQHKAGNVQALNVYYGWERDGVFNAYKLISMIPKFCQPNGTEISEAEFSLKSELLGKTLFNQFGYCTKDGVSKTELRTTETDSFTQLSFWSGAAGIFQPGSRFEVYAR